MHPASWIGWVLAVMVVALATTNPFYLSLLLLAVVLVAILAPREGPGVVSFRALAIFGVVMLALSFGIAAINGNYGDHILFTLPGPRVPEWLGGLRLGWAYAPPAVADVLNRIRSPFNASRPAQAAAIAALADSEHVAASRAHAASRMASADAPSPSAAPCFNTSRRVSRPWVAASKSSLNDCRSRIASPPATPSIQGYTDATLRLTRGGPRAGCSRGRWLRARTRMLIGAPVRRNRRPARRSRSLTGFANPFYRDGVIDDITAQYTRLGWGGKYSRGDNVQM